MTMETGYLTWHATERMKERCNTKNYRTATKSVQLALSRGKRADDFSSWERNFLLGETSDRCTPIAYNGFCYIMNEEDACVTIFALPSWFGKKKHFDGKERIRDYKKYCKNNEMYCDHRNVH